MGALPREAGFTIIELMVAATISLLVVMGAFISINLAHETSLSQSRAVELIAQARVVLDQIGRDVRSAGDAVQLLPAHCLGGAQSPGAPFGCPAILEPHPWRITLARYQWGAGDDEILGTVDDTLPAGAFEDDPENVVTYQFVPRGGKRELGGGRTGWIGRIERITNPFGFAGAEPRLEVLLDDVLVDDAMRQSPDGAEFDHRRNHAVFLYQLLSMQSGEYEGDAEFTQRATREGSFVLPPARLFALPADPATWAVTFAAAPPYVPNDWVPEIVGLRQAATTTDQLRPGKAFDADLRYVLDFNRIRAVHVAFKVVESREDPAVFDGVDLDPSAPGTARVILMESTYEMKPLTSYLR